ncbi:MAG: hypothetical protein NC117_03395 [Pseudoflavonifractor sp.]|nr:hypothetical protein [Pseudoflavonifractor sp.]
MTTTPVDIFRLIGNRVRAWLILSLLPLSLLMTGCFTGIESTPRINADDAGKEAVRTTPEQSFLADVDAQPFGAWTPGKRFYVTDPKVSLVLGASAVEFPLAAGDTLVFVGGKEMPSVTGQGSTDLSFTGPGGHEYIYRVSASGERLASRKRVDIPFVIEMSIPDSVAARLTGRTLYTRTPLWYDDSGEVVMGRRFVPVTVTKVTPGDAVYPVRVYFTEVGNPDKTYSLFLSVGEGTPASRTFASQFYFDNPRSLYPSVTDSVWDNIINSQVAVGMTRDECRLSLGAPADISRRYGRDRLRELWSYPDGTYLVFEDGLLWEFRR